MMYGTYAMASAHSAVPLMHASIMWQRHGYTGLSSLHGVCTIHHAPLVHMPWRELVFDASMPITINVNSLEYWTGCSVQLKAFKQEDYCADKELNQIRTLCPGSA